MPTSSQDHPRIMPKTKQNHAQIMSNLFPNHHKITPAVCLYCDILCCSGCLACLLAARQFWQPSMLDWLPGMLLPGIHSSCIMAAQSCCPTCIIAAMHAFWLPRMHSGCHAFRLPGMNSGCLEGNLAAWHASCIHSGPSMHSSGPACLPACLSCSGLLRTVRRVISIDSRSDLCDFEALSWLPEAA